MSAPPRLCIGLPVYNGERFLAASLDSLLGQTFEEFDLVVSDNASSDATPDICEEYRRRDPRVRFVRQRVNIGSALNHHFVFLQGRSELFKWAAADDLYARDLFVRCVDALDERPDVVLAHAWTAAIDDDGRVVQALEYPLDTGSPSAPRRFRSLLLGAEGDEEGLIRSDDEYGMMRSEVLRQVLPQGSYYHSDYALMAAVALRGPFFQHPDWLYFRRDHRGRPQYACPTVRAWCTNLDPRRADRLRHPTARLLAEYPLAYLDAIRRAPLSPADRRTCYRHLARWSAIRAVAAVRRAVDGGGVFPVPVPPPPSPPRTTTVSVESVVAGQAGG